MWNRRSLLAGILAASLPSVALAGPKPLLQRRFVVVVDPGHGGTNAGCVASDHEVLEKSVTLAMATELRAAMLDRMPDAEVLLTREGDESLTLADRVAFANAAGADIFISLHANASESRSQHGFETYVLDARASSLEAARTARRENDERLADPSPGGEHPEAEMMVRQLEMAAHRSGAIRLAQAIQSEQAARFAARVDRGVKQAPFDVLMGARMPAVLFEAGFLDHPSEGPMLMDPHARAPIVDGVVAALVRYYRSLRQTG